MDKYVVIRTDNEDINVVAYKDNIGNAVDVMTKDFFEYLDEKQKADILMGLLCNEEDATEFVYGSLDNDSPELWMSAEVSDDDYYHNWKIIPVAFEEKKEN